MEKKLHISITAKDVAQFKDCSISTAKRLIRAVKLAICKDNAKPTFKQFFDYYGYEIAN